MQKINHYVNYLDIQDLNTDMIYFNEDNIIDRFLVLFENYLEQVEDNSDLKEIIQALYAHKISVQNIIQDLIYNRQKNHGW